MALIMRTERLFPRFIKYQGERIAIALIPKHGFQYIYDNAVDSR